MDIYILTMFSLAATILIAIWVFSHNLRTELREAITQVTNERKDAITQVEKEVEKVRQERKDAITQVTNERKDAITQVEKEAVEVTQECKDAINKVEAKIRQIDAALSRRIATIEGEVKGLSTNYNHSTTSPSE